MKRPPRASAAVPRATLLPALVRGRSRRLTAPTILAVILTVALVLTGPMLHSGSISVTTASPHLSFIQMVSPSAGWGRQGDRILRTVDAWRHWTDVSPPGMRCQPSVVSCSPTAFLDGQHAWVAVPILLPRASRATGATVYRTSDGGHRWRLSTISFGERAESIGQITFANARDGWMWITRAVGVDQDYFDIFRTTDGGASWKRVYLAGAAGAGHPPHCNCFEGMSFEGPTVGWISGANTMRTAAGPFLFRTADGGHTWRRCFLPTPLGQSKMLAITLPPLFFGARNGILPVTFSTGIAGELYIYRTTNGGVSWTLGTPLPSSPTPVPYDFVSFQLGFVAWGRSLTTTVDAGRRWRQITVRAPWTPSQIEFVDSQRGFAIGFPDEHNRYPPLLMTADGGNTWSPL